MRLIPTTLLLLLFANASLAAGSVGKKASFTENDVFRSAYFLKNTEGLVTDYNGAPVHYFTRYGAVNAFFTDNTLIYRVVNLDSNRTKQIREEAEEAEEKSGKPGKDNDYKPIALNMRYVSVTWLGANPHPKIESFEPNSGYYTYLAGTTAQDRHSIITQGYKKIVYRDLYPGIDVEYVLPGKGGMEYTLTVHPGADLSQVKMQYSMDILSITNNGQGSIVIHTQAGDIVEHAPVSYMANGAPVASNFVLQGNTASFATPQGYDHNSTLIVDPWVDVLTQLTTSNVGTMTDFDATGNLYVYGAGATSESDLSTYYKSAKFDLSGTNLWVFNGNVPLVGWSSQDPAGSWNYMSGMKVDRTTGKTYYGQGYAVNGSQIVRLTAAGVYDNFESPANSIFRETWSFVSNCLTGDILALGGGTNSDLNMGVINPITAALTTSNITGDLTDYQQDIVSGAYDATGNLYAVFASVAAFSVNNYIFKSNTTYTGSVWNTPTNFGTLNESNNIPGFAVDISNNFNALAANGSYLFYCDGYNLQAYNLTTGATVGSLYNLPYTALVQGGIAVDNCNNVYVGGQGVIKTFSFNGSTFTPGTDISLGTGFTSNNVLDVRYNSTNNLLYVTGYQMVGTYAAINSGACNVVTTFTSSVTPGCGQSIVTVTPGTGLTNPVFSYLWEDSNGTIIKQTPPGTATHDTLSTPTAGLYTVQVQLNINCGGAAHTDTFRVVCEQLTVSPDTTVCAGQPVNLRAYGTPAGGTYLWSPGGQTTSSITVTPPNGSTYYRVTYTVPGQPPLTDSILVTTTSGPTVTVSDTGVCTGGTATLTATPSIPGGTYLWSPGGATTSSITVSPTSTSTYTVVYTIAHCNAATDSGIVTVTPTTVTTHDTTVCAGQTVTLTATANTSGGLYVWTPGPDSTQSYTVTPTGTTTYTIIYKKPGCRADTAHATVTTTPDPTVTVNDTALCIGGTATLTATPSITGGTYLWAPGGATTQSISVSPGTTTAYTVTYSVRHCGTAVDSGIISVVQRPTITTHDTTVCAGQTATLTATANIGGGLYIWAPGPDSTQSITVTPATTSTYTVVYTTAGCLPDTAQATVNVVHSSTVTVAADTICTGGTATLTAVPVPAGGTYLWAPGGATTQSIMVSPTSNTSYTVTYTTANCGAAVDSNTVTVIPTIVTAHDTTVCVGQTVTLTATANNGGGLYVWTPGPDSTQSYTVTPTGTTTYMVIYKVPGCNADTAHATVTTTPDPTVTVNDTALCAGGTTSLIATPSIAGGTYLWAPGGATSQTISVSPGSTTTYTVTYSLLHCGIAVDSGIVSVVQRPTLTTRDTAVCTGGTITISAGANISGGLYIWSPGPDSTQSITVTPATTSTYTVVYVTPGCAPDTANLTVNVVTAATVSVAPDTICAGNTATLTAVPVPGGGTYLWAPGGATTQSITVSPTSNTSYTVTYNSGACGSAVDSNTVVVLPKPVLTTHDTVACAGQSVTLTANATVGGGIYVWTPGPDSTQNYTVSPAVTTTYTVIYNLRGCTPDTAHATFTITPPPTVTLGADTTICAGGTATLNAVPNPAGGNYTWAPGGAVTQGISVTPATATTYTVTYAIAGCTPATATETVNIYPPLALSLVTDTPLCFGAATGAVLATVTPAGTYTYHWNNGDSLANNTNVGAGAYSLTVTDANGCTVQGSAVVAQGPTATLETFPADTTVLQGNSVQLTTVFTPSANVSGVTYSWTADTVLSCLTCPNPLVSTNGNPDTFNVYQVTVTYNGGCTVTANDTVRVLLTDICVAPSAFTPNGDGMNDTYFILAHGEVAFKLDIYNRWGQLVFTSTDIHHGWDGTYRGKDQPQGEYTTFYSVTYRDGKQESHTGSIMLFR